MRRPKCSHQVTTEDLFFQVRCIKPNLEYLSADIHLKFGSKPIKHKGSLVNRKEHYLIGQQSYSWHVLSLPTFSGVLCVCVCVCKQRSFSTSRQILLKRSHDGLFGLLLQTLIVNTRPFQFTAEIKVGKKKNLKQILLFSRSFVTFNFDAHSFALITELLCRFSKNCNWFATFHSKSWIQNCFAGNAAGHPTIVPRCSKEQCTCSERNEETDTRLDFKIGHSFTWKNLALAEHNET